MLIEIGRLKEQLKEAHNRETAALQAYSDLERYHGGGPVQVTFGDDGDDDKPTEATAAATV